jgi:DNA helicase-2/ATP-dependent DNA helicase PcrA
MANIEEFMAYNKSMIIAPAGYGKTHTITECLRVLNTSKKCLILTHTHAGVASIKEKIQKEGIDSSKFSLDTISSFALRFTNAFHINKVGIPKVENSNDYFNFAIETANKLFQSNPLKAIIKSTYSHLIVDEYQDCTQLQHKLILVLANIIPTHILGDPLQGIFEFGNNILVDMESDEEMQGLNQNNQTLDTPWRWNRQGSAKLGQALAEIRESFINRRSINLNNYTSQITIIIEPENNYTVQNSAYKRVIWHELNNRNTDSLLLIHPISTSVNPRIKFIQIFNNTLRLIESIDDKEYYKYANLFDTKTEQELINQILNFAKLVSSKTIISNWFLDNGILKKKRDAEDRLISDGIQATINRIIQTKSFIDISLLINQLLNLPDSKCYRKELVNDMVKSLKMADAERIPVYEAMKKTRDTLRRVGRNVKGRCIGTTLLTKGLEFDTVIVLNAHQFTDAKHLYVALTRASKKLIVISQTSMLNPY